MPATSSLSSIFVGAEEQVDIGGFVTTTFDNDAFMIVDWRSDANLDYHHASSGTTEGFVAALLHDGPQCRHGLRFAACSLPSRSWLGVAKNRHR
jgi:hypothetical protein